MKSKLLAILFSMVLLLMAFSAAAADHLTLPDTEESGASLVGRISIAGADYWSFFSDQLDSQEGASLPSQLTISGDEDWAYQQ